MKWNTPLFHSRVLDLLLVGYCGDDVRRTGKNFEDEVLRHKDLLNKG